MSTRAKRGRCRARSRSRSRSPALTLALASSDATKEAVDRELKTSSSADEYARHLALDQAAQVARIAGSIRQEREDAERRARAIVSAAAAKRAADARVKQAQDKERKCLETNPAAAVVTFCGKLHHAHLREEFQDSADGAKYRAYKLLGITGDDSACEPDIGALFYFVLEQLPSGHWVGARQSALVKEHLDAENQHAYTEGRVFRHDAWPLDTILSPETYYRRYNPAIDSDVAGGGGDGDDIWDRANDVERSGPFDIWHDLSYTDMTADVKKKLSSSPSSASSSSASSSAMS